MGLPIYNLAQPFSPSDYDKADSTVGRDILYE